MRLSIEIPILCIHNDTFGNGRYLPQYQTTEASGMDICFRAGESEGTSIQISPGDTVTVRTGIALAIPEGWEGLVRPRSGYAKKGILVHLGTIDADYRGEIKVTLTNVSKNNFFISDSERIAQLVIQPTFRAVWKFAQSLSTTERGENGFGSTGSF